MNGFIFLAAAFFLTTVLASASPHAGAQKLALAKDAVQNGKAQKALVILKGVEDEVPELARYVFFVRGEALLAAGKSGAAEMFLQAAENETLESESLETEALERAALAFEKRGDGRRAAEIFGTLIKSGGGERLDFYLKKTAELAEKNGEKILAARLWKRLWRERPLSDFSDLAAERAAALGDGDFPLRSDLADRADALFEKRKWKSALAVYRELPPGGRRDARMATCLYRTGRKNPKRLKEALSLLEGVNSAEGVYTTGVVLAALGKTAESGAKKAEYLRRSRRVFRSVHKRFPGSPEAGKALMREQRTGGAKKAEEIYRVIKDRYPSLRADAGWRAGWAFYRAGNFEKAERIFSENGRDKKSFLGGQFEYWRARIAEKRGNAAEARRIFAKLADGPFSYYSFLASERVASGRGGAERITPESPVSDKSDKKPFAGAKAEAVAGNGHAGVRRARLLAEAGLGGWAKDEARLAAADKPNDACAVLAGLGDFDFCIKLTGNNPPDRRLRLAFPKGFEREVKTHAGNNGVSEHLVYSLIREESRFAAEAVSVANAYGLMQLIMPTAREVASEDGEEIKSREELFEPSLNIRLGTRYLGRMIKRFGGDIPAALAAYNAGPSRAKRWKEGALNGLPPDEFTESVPFDETRNYIRRIFRSYGAYGAVYPPGE